MIDADEEQEEEDDGEGEEESSEEMGEGVIAVAFAEHQVVNALIQELKHMGQGDQFREKFAELKDDVLDHVAAEEDVIFPAALLKLDVVGLAAQMQKRKRDLMSEAAGK